jgi:hypothetical protein
MKMCRIVAWVFTFLYAAALVLLLIGTFGLFGNEQDPLSAVFLVPLGLPWVLLVDLAPEPAWPWLGALTPAINLALLWALCSRLKNRHA